MALPYLYLLSVVSMRYYHPEDSGHVNLYVSGYRDTIVDYLLPWEHESKRILLNEANDRRWSASFMLTADQEDFCTKMAIRVRTSHQVTIQVSRGKLQLTNTAAYTAIPLTDDSKQFLVSSQPNARNGLKGSQPIFVIGAGAKQAKVKIYDRGAEQKASFLFSRTLAPYEMLEIGGGPLNITGTYLSSDRPIVVYSGHQCANVPTEASFCEPLLQQVPPFSRIGAEYIMGPIKQRDRAGYTARIITTRQGSDVILATKEGHLQIENANIRGCTLTDLGEVYNVQCRSPFAVGTYIDVHATPSTLPLVVKCSAPCYVYQLNRGGSEPAIGVRSDPFMALVPPLTQKASAARFATVSSYSDGGELLFRNFVSVIAPRNELVLLDGLVLAPDTGYTVGDYKVYSGEISHGFHEVRTSDREPTSLVVQVYGHGPDSPFTGRSAYGLAGSYVGSEPRKDEPELVPAESTRTFRTVTPPLPTRRRPVVMKTTTAADLPHYATDVISALVPLPSVSPVKAVTTGILAAISVAVIIIVLCCVVMAIILIVLRRRNSKCKALVLDTASVMATNTIVCVNQTGEIMTLKSVQNDPDYWRIHDVSCVLKPNYDAEEDATYGYIARSETGNDVKLKPEDSDYVEVAPPGGDLLPGYKSTEKDGYRAVPYDSLDGRQAHDNDSCGILNPSTV